MFSIGDFFKKRSKALNKSTSDLLSFSPQKIYSGHEYIIRQLKRATRINNVTDNNIALDGDYGVGKSSIIYELRSCLLWRLLNRPKIVSFLSFSIKNEGTKPGTKKYRKKLSEYLQSEIVRQSYYGEPSDKLKHSGYKRIGAHHYILSPLVGTLIGAIVTYRLYGNDFIGIWQSPEGLPMNIIFCTWIILCISFTFIASIILTQISNGSIKGISAKNISADLTDNKPDFDQLIDLIIYYFHKTHRRVIIFEDIDRLGSPEIFEELHQLNFVLNNRLRIFGKVKFIYAIKGSSFSNYETEVVGIEQINTKVFDLVIPVIPFLTKINFNEVFQEEYKKSKLDMNIASIDKILSRHTSDMRVVKSVINNILIYANTFNELQTEEDYNNIAALSVIRVFCPDDFAKFSTGNSVLDLTQNECLKNKRKRIDAISKEYRIKHIHNNIRPILELIWGISSSYPLTKMP